MTRIHKKRPATADVLLDLPDTYEGTGAIKTPVGNQTVRRFRRGKTWVSILSGVGSIFASYKFAMAFTAPEYWVDGTQYGEGPELVSNGTLDNATGWDPAFGGGGAAITGGKLVFTNSNASPYHTLNSDPSGKYIHVVCDVEITSGTLTLTRPSGGWNGVPLSAGRNDFYVWLPLGGNPNISFTGALFTGTVDNLSIKLAAPSSLPGYTFHRPGEQGMVRSVDAPVVARTLVDENFDTDLGDFKAKGTASVSLDNGKMRVTAGATPGGGAELPIYVQQGQAYRLQCTLAAGTGGRYRISVVGSGWTLLQQDSWIGPNVDITFIAPASMGQIISVMPSTFAAHGNPNDWMTIDDLRLEQITGHLVEYAQPHAPAINDLGYHTYGAVTNGGVYSNDLNSLNPVNCTVASNIAIAPDGAKTLDVMTATAGLSAVEQSCAYVAGDNTVSVMVPKSGNTAAYAYLQANTPGAAFSKSINLATGALFNNDVTPPAAAYVIDCGAFWRLVMVLSGVTAGTSVLYYGQSENSNDRVATVGKTLGGWALQCLNGKYPDGGPIIRTTGATASLGASTLYNTIPPLADEPCLIWGTVQFASLPNDYSRFFELIKVLSPSSERIEVAVLGGAVYTAVVAGGNNVASGVVPLAIPLNTPVTAFLKRTTTGWRLGMAVNGVITWAGPETVGAFPVGLDRWNHGLYYGGSTYEADGAIKGGFVKIGNFSDDEIRAILLGYPVESGHVFVAPVSKVAPAITGLTQTGKTLTVSQGSWDQFPFSFAYQWTRNGANIAGATNSTYVLQAADIDQTVSCKVTATNPAGSTVATANNVTGIVDPADAPHLHWRVFFPNAENIGIDEIAFYDETETNVNAETTAKFSSPTWNDGTPEFAPAKAFDGNNATYWNTLPGNPGNAYLGASFAVPRNIRKVTLRYSDIARGFTALRIQFSDDLVTWSDYSRPFIPQGKKANYTFHVHKQNMGLLFRFYTTDKDGAVNAAIREIDFNGDVPVGPASGTTAWGGVPAQAVDGNPDTRWISGGEANPILLWRGQSPDIEDYNNVRIRAFYQAGNGDRMPKGFRLAYSADEGDNWTQFADITGPSWVTDNEIRTFPIA